VVPPKNIPAMVEYKPELSVSTLKKTVDLSNIDISENSSNNKVSRVNWFEVLKKSSSPEKRKDAVRTLGNFNSSGVINSLVECALKDKSRDVRLEALETLVKLGDSKALDGLLKGIKEEKDVEIRKRMAWAYSQIKYKSMKK